MATTTRKNEIKQADLLFEENMQLRVVDDSYAYLTLSTFHSAQIRTEYEYSIPLTDAYELFSSSKVKLVKISYLTGIMLTLIFIQTVCLY
jgi:CYTH domain-containing protein